MRAPIGPERLRELTAALGERVLVLGCPGAGKTTIATRLAEHLGVPCTHLDDVYFGPGWTPMRDERWRAALRACCESPQWILDGNHASSLDVRLPRATGVLLVREPTARCLVRFVRRAARTRFRGPIPEHMRDLRTGRPKVVSRPLRFAWFILTFRRRVLPGMLAALARLPELPVLCCDSNGNPVSLREVR